MISHLSSLLFVYVIAISRVSETFTLFDTASSVEVAFEVEASAKLSSVVHFFEVLLVEDWVHSGLFGDSKFFTKGLTETGPFAESLAHLKLRTEILGSFFFSLY